MIEAGDGPVWYEFKLWATPLPTVKDWKKAYDWPAEGENFLNWIQVKATNRSGRSGGCPAGDGVQAGPAGCGKDLSPWTLGARSERHGNGAGPVLGRSRTLRVSPRPIPSFGSNGQRTTGGRSWRLRPTSRCPCWKATEALKAAHVCQLIASDHGDVHGGEGFYDQFYIRDGAYQVMELEEAGLWDAARAKPCSSTLDRQRPDGRFESQKGQFDANGQALWVLWQFYKITDDRAWLETVYPAMRRAVDWTMQPRREEPADSPTAGGVAEGLGRRGIPLGGARTISWAMTSGTYGACCARPMPPAFSARPPRPGN